MSSEIEELVGRLLSLLGEDISRDGLRETPKRVEQALRFLTKGYRQEMGEVLNGAIFAVESNEMVIVRDIDFFSLCEHHMLPFFGKCHVAYLPNGRVIGLSKIPRLVELYSRRFQVQERLTMDIASAVEEGVGASGVGVVMEAQHLCMMMRGVEKQNALAVTSAMLGTFKSDSKTRMEFLDLIRRPRG
ncbi:MAG TPA: GTP cyclohydrolase I FolE [Nitrospiria bacterium]|nr:GTP cyclohydrolase I FolE [Nitrospiria bacterium]